MILSALIGSPWLSRDPFMHDLPGSKPRAVHARNWRGGMDEHVSSSELSPASERGSSEVEALAIRLLHGNGCVAAARRMIAGAARTRWMIGLSCPF